jgi:hypothetical protein
MMHPYTLSRRWLAVPGIGFPQNISVGPNALDLEDFRDRPAPIRIQRFQVCPKGCWAFLRQSILAKLRHTPSQDSGSRHRPRGRRARMRHGSDDVRRPTTHIRHAARRRGGQAARGARTAKRRDKDTGL